MHSACTVVACANLEPSAESLLLALLCYDTGCDNSTDRYQRRYCENGGGSPYYNCKLPASAPLASCCAAMDDYDDDIGTLGICESNFQFTDSVGQAESKLI